MWPRMRGKGGISVPPMPMEKKKKNVFLACKGGEGIFPKKRKKKGG